MKIYFAHSKKDYNTEYELKCIERINELHPGSEIVNPRDIITGEETDPTDYKEFMQYMAKYFFSVIKTCNLVIAVPTNTGKITSGVMKEVKYALANDIKVSNLDVDYPTPNNKVYRCGNCGIKLTKEECYISVQMEDVIVKAYQPFCLKCSEID